MKTNFFFSQSPPLKSIRPAAMARMFLLAFTLFFSSTSHAQLSPCNANISWSVDSLNPFLFHFCNASDFVPGSYGFTFSWDLGDGSWETDSCFSHLYTMAGTYTICLEVHACDPYNGGASCGDDTCIVIVIGSKGGGGNDTTSVVPALSSAEVYKVFPNPAFHSAMIQYLLRVNANVTISVFDVQGKKLYVQTSDEAAGYHHQILNEEIFPVAGIYFVHVATDKGTHRVMVICKE